MNQVTQPSKTKNRTAEGDSPTSTKKRPTGITQRKWTDEEIGKILDYMKETLLKGYEIEKPTATAYYTKMNEVLKLADVNPEKMRSKVAYLKTSYTRAITWRSQTGQGLAESDGADAVNDHIHKLCQLFEQLDEIYVHKANVNPPYVYDSGAGTLDNGLENIPGTEIQTVEEHSPTQGTSANSGAFLSDIEKIRLKLGNSNSRSGKGLGAGKKDGITSLCEFQSQRADVLKKRIEFDEKRLANEDAWKEKEFLYRGNELKLMEKRIDNEKELKLLEIEKDERIAIAKFKIEADVKLN